MIIKPNWDIFKAKFNENPRENFEWFCYLLFSKEYNQPHGTHRYKNQSGIETDPIEIGSEVIGWQSKFYEDSLSNHRDDLLGTLIKSKRDYPHITKIILYTNSEWGQGQGGKEPKAKIDIEEKSIKLAIKLVWRVKSYFESSFVCIDNGIISKYFFTKGGFLPSFNLISKRMKESIQSVGKRYAPNSKKYILLNQTISIADIFNHYSYRNIVKLINDYINLKPHFFSEDYYSFDHTKYIKEYIKKSEIGIRKDEIINFLEGLTDAVLKDYDILNGDLFMVTEHLKGIRKTQWEDDVKNDKKDISKKHEILKQLKKILFSDSILFYKKSLLLLSGEALIGKTHLFCDVTLFRLRNTHPTLLFFGNQFNETKSIISNMITQLGLVSVSEEEFLQVLNMWGEEYSTSTLIMIDAINETENPKIWQDGIIKFCNQIKSYPNLALAMSIRDVEKNKIITPENEEYITNEIVEVEHKGFEGIELEAVRTFCEALDVEFPKVPIHTYRLFVNPGMLFLYIETIKNSTKKVDTSIINPLTIFKSYIVDLERKYYQKYMDEIDEEDEVVFEAIEEFISLGTQKDYLHFYLDYKEVKKKLKPLHNKILEFLISEGVLNKLKQDSVTKVYFTYQKFENFFIANYLLNDFEIHKDKIGDILFSYENNALVEAFFMQISQKLGQEPFDLYPNILDEYALCELYFDSLVWREPKYFTEKTFEYIDKIQNNWEGISSKYLEVGLQLSSIPHHPLNILSLHQELLDMTMLQRDYKWSIKIHNLFIEDKIVKRIIHWAWDKKEEFEIEDESLYLYGLTLGWFLTSSNRELRDGATKALVNLFTDRVDVFLSVLHSFEMINDLYVLERLYSVSYGIVLRSENQNGFSNLGEYIYKTIFDKSEVVEHIFLRDYAKSTVEYINNLTYLNIDIQKVLPPYNQHLDWNLSDEKIEDIEEYRDDYSRIYFSTIKGDFKKYIIYPYANHFLNLKIKNRPHSQMPKVRYDNFFNSLSEIQKVEYNKARVESTEMLEILKFKNDEFDEKLTTIKEKKLNESNFKELLSFEQLEEFNSFIVSYKQAGMYANGLNVKIVKRLVFLEVLKLGWNKELFEEFDNNANFDRGRDRGIDRIGKKYQWIALYKVLSKIFDTYELKEDEYKDKISEFKGMYQFSFKRDIDPTTILKSKKEEEHKWWFNIDKRFENYELSDIDWMNSSKKLPKLSDIINLIHNGNKYLLLDINFSIDGSKNRETYRNLYYHLNSFIVKKDKEKEILDWMGKQKFYARKMPESKYFYDPYLREYPNSEAYKYIDNDYNSQPNWDDRFSNANNIPDKVLLTATGYFKERGELDHSIVDSMEIKLPNKWFINKMNLKQILKDGEWVNKQKEVVFLDPTVVSGSISTFNENGVLIADKNLLLNFLEKNGYTIFWILWGEKQVRNNEGFNSKDFLGIAEISGYGYFDSDEFVENIDVEFERKD